MSPDDEPDCASARTRPKNGESETPRFAMRNERFREGGRKSLKSLGREMSNFAESFVFNDLTAFLFRAFRETRPPGPKRAGRADRKSALFRARDPEAAGGARPRRRLQFHRIGLGRGDRSSIGRIGLEHDGVIIIHDFCNCQDISLVFSISRTCRRFRRPFAGALRSRLSPGPILIPLAAGWPGPHCADRARARSAGVRRRSVRRCDRAS